MIHEIKQAAHGNWKSILISFGIPEEQLNGKSQPCMFCGGKDRARWIEAKEYYFCNQCDSRSRDPLSVIKEYNGMTFPAVKNELADMLGVKEQKTSSAEMQKIKHEQRTARYLKAVRYTILASNHRFPFTAREIHWIKEAKKFVKSYRKDNPSYLLDAGI